MQNYIVKKCKDFHWAQLSTLKRSAQVIETDIQNVREKIEILNIVKEKSQKVFSYKDICIHNNKNLIYYCVFGDYCNIFALSLRSLKKTNSNNFDLLVITDEDTKKKIELMELNLDFMIVKTPSNGIEASKLKTIIFKYKHIDNYENILYLDCDVMAVKSINFLFNEKIKENKLYTVQETFFKDILDSPYHGFGIFHQNIVSLMEKNNQVPFNAGQFLFKNTFRMKLHFDNLIWFMNNWKFQSFFEQSFMNYYFNTNLLTDKDHLSNYVLLYRWKNGIKPDVKLVHFLGEALEYKDKMKNINKFYKLKLN